MLTLTHHLYVSSDIFLFGLISYVDLKGTNTHPYGHMVKNMQTELMVEIYSKGLVRAFGKVFFMKLSQNTDYNS